MENVTRTVLIDEKLLGYKPMLKHYQTKQEQDMTRKRPITRQMKSIMDDPAIPEDAEAKHYE